MKLIDASFCRAIGCFDGNKNRAKAFLGDVASDL